MTEPLFWNGSFEEKPFPTLLTEIRGGGKTGILIAKSGDSEKRIFFQNGEPVASRSNHRKDLIGEILCARGRISREQLEEALEEVRKKTGENFGRILVRKGFLEPKDLYSECKYQFISILFSLFPWQEGTFTFQGEEASQLIPEDLPRFHVKFSKLVSEGIRLVKDAAFLDRVLGDPARVVRPGPVTVPSQDLSFGGEEKAVLDALQEGRSIQDLLDSLSQDPLRVKKILYTLSCLGAVEIAAPGRTAEIQAAEEAEEELPALSESSLSEFMSDIIPEEAQEELPAFAEEAPEQPAGEIIEGEAEELGIGAVPERPERFGSREGEEPQDRGWPEPPTEEAAWSIPAGVGEGKSSPAEGPEPEPEGPQPAEAEVHAPETVPPDGEPPFVEPEPAVAPAQEAEKPSPEKQGPPAVAPAPGVRRERVKRKKKVRSPVPAAVAVGVVVLAALAALLYFLKFQGSEGPVPAPSAPERGAPVVVESRPPAQEEAVTPVETPAPTEPQAPAEPLETAAVEPPEAPAQGAPSVERPAEAPPPAPEEGPPVQTETAEASAPPWLEAYDKGLHNFRDGNLKGAFAAWTEVIRLAPEQAYTIQVEISSYLNFASKDIQEAAEGERVFLVPILLENKSLYRVLCGVYAGRSEAEAALKQLSPYLKAQKPALVSMDLLKEKLDR